uniref:Uncharacterized protein n=1 Tax=Minutocellus polymorphus TaxID=265543 RepID=A0A7S0ABE7_9STRA
MGADFSPVAALLPIKLLLEMFGVALVAGFGERFFTAIAKELDRRLATNEDKLLPETNGEALSRPYVLGDLTKQAIQAYTGKNKYEAGDISGTSSSDGEVGIGNTMDVLQELEECLAMERELVERLSKVTAASK